MSAMCAGNLNARSVCRIAILAKRSTAKCVLSVVSNAVLIFVRNAAKQLDMEVMQFVLVAQTRFFAQLGPSWYLYMYIICIDQYCTLRLSLSYKTTIE